jgi:hypothetical protein
MDTVCYACAPRYIECLHEVPCPVLQQILSRDRHKVLFGHHGDVGFYDIEPAVRFAEKSYAERAVMVGRALELRPLKSPDALEEMRKNHNAIMATTTEQVQDVLNKSAKQLGASYTTEKAKGEKYSGLSETLAELNATVVVHIAEEGDGRVKRKETRLNALLERLHGGD